MNNMKIFQKTIILLLCCLFLLFAVSQASFAVESEKRAVFGVT
jgi:CHASE3 domain sensor protein